MPDVETIEQEIRARLAEIGGMIEPLRREAEQLELLLAALDGEDVAKERPRRSPNRTTRTGASPTSRPGRATGAAGGRAGTRGSRAREALAKIVEQPGITAPELARAMAMPPNYLYRLLPRLEQEAKIVKRGRGYHPAEVETTAPTNGRRVSA